jgi:hypothetical protein
MKFPGIKQILAIIFTLKITFYFILNDFLSSSIVRTIKPKSRASVRKTLRLRVPLSWTTGYFPENEGFICKSDAARVTSRQI